MPAYTPQSSLLSPGRIGQAVWSAALSNRIRGFEANQISDIYHRFAPREGLNPDLALAQACEETGWFTSRRWLEQNNPCGLGITSDDVPGHQFASPEEGIRAHLDHLCAYAFPAAACPVPHLITPDFRHRFHDGNPALSHLQDETRQWATKPGYVGRILAIANRLLPEETPSMDALAKLADRQILMPASNKNWGQTTMRGGWPSWITVHETGNQSPGANAEMHARFVGNGGGRDIERGGKNGGVSFQAVVDEVESIQIMPWNAVAWHASDGDGDGNFDSIAIETCQIGDFAKTIRNLVKLIARLMAEFSIPLDHVVQHNHWAPDKKNCPEFMRRNSNALWNGLIAAVKVATSIPAPTASGVVTPARDWDGQGEIIHTFSEVIVRNDQGKVYLNSERDGTVHGWIELTRGT